jgi:hypothetical protein
MGWWLKLVHWTGSREDASYWREVPWVTDAPGNSSSLWDKRPRPVIEQVRPAHGPRYEVDDRLVVCIANARGCPPELVRKVPAILVVTKEPRWDPLLVDREGYRSNEGDRWGVVTAVRCLNAVEPRTAPAVEDIGVIRSSLNQKGYRHLTDEQGEHARALLEALEPPDKRRRHSAKPPPKPVVLPIPIEKGKVETYDTKTKKEIIRATREESKLVEDFAAYLIAQGDLVFRHKITVPGAAGSLYSDLYNETRGQLIEAKAGTSRSDVRMAIGQLADYARMLMPPPRRAVLLEARPSQDLVELLYGQGIAVIWRDGAGFTDSADKLFT